MTLERVIGCTSLTNSSFASCAATGELAYAAGAVLVLFNPKRKQQPYRFLRARQAITAVAFTQDGEYVAAGQRGRRPTTQVWAVASGTLRADVGNNGPGGPHPHGGGGGSGGAGGGPGGAAPTASLLAPVGSAVEESKGHLGHAHGVACVAFTPNGRLLITAGFKNDRGLHVWDWRGAGTGAGAGVPVRVGAGKLSQKVLSISVFPSGAGFATAGDKHLKFWSLEPVLAALQANQAGPASPLVLASKPAILSEAGPDFETFVDVACQPPVAAPATAASAAAPSSTTAATPASATSPPVFALTSAGMLCGFDGNRLMDRWVHVRARAAFAMDVTADAVYVACADGIVRVFAPSTLAFRGTLPLPPAVGRAHVTVADPIPQPSAAEVYPAGVAVRADAAGVVNVVYGDRSLFAWDASDLDRVLKLRSSAGHAGPVWDVCIVPGGEETAASPPLLLADGAGAGGAGASISSSASTSSSAASFPPGSFVTCGADCTVRAWNLNARATLTRKEWLAAAAAATKAASGGAIAAASASAPAAAGRRESDATAAGLDAALDGDGEGAGAGANDVTGRPSTAALGPGGVAAALPNARPRSIYMREQLMVLYVDEDARGSIRSGGTTTPLGATTVAAGSPGSALLPGRSFPPGSWPTRQIATAPFDTEAGAPGTSAVAEIGVRSLALHPLGARHIATGDRQGTVRVFDTATGALICSEVAHDAEVTCMAYANVDGRLLATGSRDRLVHVFDSMGGGGPGGGGQEEGADPSNPPLLPLRLRPSYGVLTTLPDHTSAVTAISFTRDDSQLVTAGMDNAIVFSKVVREPTTAATSAPTGGISAGGGAVGLESFRRVCTPYGAVLDMDVDATNKNLVTSGADKRLHVWSLRTGKLVRSYKSDRIDPLALVAGAATLPVSKAALEGDATEVNRVILDPSGLFIAAASLDRVVRLYDFYSGSCVARLGGHADVVTGLAFLPDGRRLVTVSADSTVMVWRLAASVTKAMTERLREIDAQRAGTAAIPRALPAPAPVPPPSQQQNVAAVTDARVRGRSSSLSRGGADEAAAAASAVAAAPAGPVAAPPALPPAPRSASRPRAPSASPPPLPAQSSPPPLPPPAPVAESALERSQGPQTASDELTVDELGGAGPAPVVEGPPTTGSSGAGGAGDDEDLELRRSILPAWAQTQRVREDGDAGGLGAGLAAGGGPLTLSVVGTTPSFAASSIEATPAGAGTGVALAPAPLANPGGGLRGHSRWAQVVGTAGFDGTTSAAEENLRPALPPAAAATAAASAAAAAVAASAHPLTLEEMAAPSPRPSAAASAEDNDAADADADADVDADGETGDVFPKPANEATLTRESFSVSRGPGFGGALLDPHAGAHGGRPVVDVTDRSGHPGIASPAAGGGPKRGATAAVVAATTPLRQSLSLTWSQSLRFAGPPSAKPLPLGGTTPRGTTAAATTANAAAPMSPARFALPAKPQSPAPASAQPASPRARAGLADVSGGTPSRRSRAVAAETSAGFAPTSPAASPVPVPSHAAPLSPAASPTKTPLRRTLSSSSAAAANGARSPVAGTASPGLSSPRSAIASAIAAAAEADTQHLDRLMDTARTAAVGDAVTAAALLGVVGEAEGAPTVMAAPQQEERPSPVAAALPLPASPLPTMPSSSSSSSSSEPADGAADLGPPTPFTARTPSTPAHADAASASVSVAPPPAVLPQPLERYQSAVSALLAAMGTVASLYDELQMTVAGGAGGMDGGGGGGFASGRLPGGSPLIPSFPAGGLGASFATLRSMSLEGGPSMWSDAGVPLQGGGGVRASVSHLDSSATTALNLNATSASFASAGLVFRPGAPVSATQAVAAAVQTTQAALATASVSPSVSDETVVATSEVAHVRPAAVLGALRTALLDVATAMASAATGTQVVGHSAPASSSAPRPSHGSVADDHTSRSSVSAGAAGGGGEGSEDLQSARPLLAELSAVGEDSGAVGARDGEGSSAAVPAGGGVRPQALPAVPEASSAGSGGTLSAAGTPGSGFAAALGAPGEEYSQEFELDTSAGDAAMPPPPPPPRQPAGNDAPLSSAAGSASPFPSASSSGGFASYHLGDTATGASTTGGPQSASAAAATVSTGDGREGSSSPAGFAAAAPPQPPPALPGGGAITAPPTRLIVPVGRSKPRMVLASPEPVGPPTTGEGVEGQKGE